MSEDEKLRELGRELERADQASAPPFDDIWRAARLRARAPKRSWLRPALIVGFGGAALATTAAGVALVVSIVETGGAAEPSAVASAQIEYEPLAFLLERPGGEP